MKFGVNLDLILDKMSECPRSYSLIIMKEKQMSNVNCLSSYFLMHALYSASGFLVGTRFFWVFFFSQKTFWKKSFSVSLLLFPQIKRSPRHSISVCLLSVSPPLCFYWNIVNDLFLRLVCLYCVSSCVCACTSCRVYCTVCLLSFLLRNTVALWITVALTIFMRLTV